MKFNCDAKELMDAIESTTLKGKYKYGDGLKSKSIGDYCYMKITGNELTLQNSDNTTAVRVKLEVDGNESGQCTVEISRMIKYLKNIKGSITFTKTDHIKINSGNANVSLPVVVVHPSIDMITKHENRIKDIEFGTPEYLPAWGKVEYEAGIGLNSANIQETMKAVESVGSGVFKLDFDGESLTISSSKLNESYSEVLEFGEKLWAAYGEEATVEVVLPFHNFYDGIFMMYLKDECPILFDDGKCSIIRAPYMGN
jgi:hypothetical protein